MTDGICFVGLDVHARKTAAAAVQLGSGEVFKARLSGPQETIGWLRSLPGEVCAVYEAGPTGFGLARAARAAGVEVMVCSSGAIPRQPGDRVKTDARDALKLARLHAAGQLRPVIIPAPALEALRDLVGARGGLARRSDGRPAPDQQAAAAARAGLGRPRGGLARPSPELAGPGSVRRAARRHRARRGTWAATRSCWRAAIASTR